jgi:glycosyltransferase involved in cell wall biosynthesis
MQPPVLSVIVCTYNREKYIGQCLAHLANQSAEKQLYEVIIVNNNSTNNSESIIYNTIRNYPETRFAYFIEMNQGHTYSRNRGIAESSGEVLAFIDDDAFVGVNYCQTLVTYFKANNSVAAIGGKIIPVYEESEPNWISKYLLPLVASLDLGDKERTMKGAKFPIGANMAFRKSIFNKYGVFDIDLGRRADELEGGDEKEIFLRLKKGRELVRYVPDASVEHIIPPHRLKESYIKGLAIGVGTSEKKRISSQGPREILRKIFSEVVKISGTIVLALGYFFSGSPSKATMLIKFRYWVVSSLIMGKE